MTTTTFRPKFSADAGRGYIRCMGTNHRDEGQRGTCLTCLRPIVRVTKVDGTKRLFDINSRYNAADRHVEDFACWQGTHTCDQEFAAKVQADRDARIAAGEAAVIGQHVIVIRGRKIAKGTIGIVTWIGEDLDYHNNLYTKLGVRTDDGAYVFIRADYVKAHTIVTVNDCLDALAGVNMPTPGSNDKPAAPRSTGSHATCDHPATKSARAACRKARNA